MKAPPTPAVESSPMVLDMPTNKDLLALHNEAWGQYQPPAVQHQQQSHPVQNLSARENQIGNGVTNHQQIQQPSAQQPIATVGQENIVRVFDELMKNMARMKSFIRPAMCKPYGKQSESLQKSKYIDITLIQIAFRHWVTLCHLLTFQHSWIPFKLCNHYETAFQHHRFQSIRGKMKIAMVRVIFKSASTTRIITNNQIIHMRGLNSSKICDQ